VCFRLLFVICVFFLCSCAVSVIGLMGVTPSHSKELDDDGYYYYYYYYYYTVIKIVHDKM
jgi:hypothetical protein